MAKRPLTAAFVKGVRHSGKPYGPDKYIDEHGLILRVMPSGSKQWIWRGTIQGKRRDLGLGSYPYVSLSEARQKAFDYRKLARAGGDPAALRSKRAVPTFREALESVLEIHSPGWKDGGKSEKQWRASLKIYAFPRIGDKRVNEIDTADVMNVLLPIWQTRSETARRVRQRIGAVMKWAIAQRYRQDNPAGEALGAALPKNAGNVKHFRAVPYSEVGAAIQKVRKSDAGITTKLLFEFITLCACRSGEARKAQWSEIDFEAANWIIPASRMKAGKEHRVPLSARAIEILREAEAVRQNDYVFPSPSGRALSDGTLTKLARSLEIPGTVHGMRSAFRDWASERTNTPHAVMEAALAHVIKNRAEAAYARSDLLEQRRFLMKSWSTYLSEGANDG